MKAFTDISQSRKLAEILPLESADMSYRPYREEGGIPDYQPDLCPHKFASWIGFPCWSLAALMNLLSSEFTEKGEYSETTYKIVIRKYALTDDVDIYQIAYGNYHWHEDGSCSWKDMINTGEKENLIDAVFQMVIWLKDNKKI